MERRREGGREVRRGEGGRRERRGVWRRGERNGGGKERIVWERGEEDRRGWGGIMDRETTGRAEWRRQRGWRDHYQMDSGSGTEGCFTAMITVTARLRATFGLFENF